MKTRTLIVFMLVILVSVAVAVGCCTCCEEDDPEGDGGGQKENVETVGTPVASQFDKCDQGSIYQGALSQIETTFGTKYRGSITILACQGDIEYVLSFKDDAGEKTIVAQGNLAQGIEYSDTFSKTPRDVTFTQFCITVAGAESKEQCFS